MNHWQQLEILIEQIYRELSPASRVKRNDKILGFETGLMREIDVSIRNTIAGHEILMIVQAKDYKSKVDVNTVGEFLSVIKDVRASKGILISKSGFTKKAIEYAKNTGLELCTAHDAENRKWKEDLKLPVVWVEIQTKMKTLVKLVLPPGTNVENFDLLKNYTCDDGKSTFTVGEAVENFLQQNDSFLLDGTKVQTITFNEPDLKKLVNDDYFPVSDLIVEIRFIRKAYLKYLTANDYRGLYDVINNKFKTSFEMYSFEKYGGKGWELVDEDKLAIHPIEIRAFAYPDFSSDKNWEVKERSTWFSKRPI